LLVLERGEFTCEVVTTDQLTGVIQWRVRPEDEGIVDFVPDAFEFALIVGFAFVAVFGCARVVADAVAHVLVVGAFPNEPRTEPEGCGTAAIVFAVAVTGSVVAASGRRAHEFGDMKQSVEVENSTSSGVSGQWTPVTVKNLAER